MMTNAELADALRGIAKEAGPLRCHGCKYEHNYGIHGCDLMREAAERIKRMDTYGSMSQIVMVFEEMSELQKELCKYLRGKYALENISEEIADVEIMLEQMKMLFCCADDVRDVRRKKVERLKERLEALHD